MRVYQTIQGDMWDLIAYKMLGSEEHMAALIEANPAHRATVIFPAGVQLVVPDIAIADTSDTLPPWKRGESG